MNRPSRIILAVATAIVLVAGAGPAWAASWVVQTSASPTAFFITFQGVATTSSTNAWAVGWYADNSGDHTLIEHLQGSTWTQVPSPNPGSAGNFLYGVRGSSASNVWAVGVREDSGSVDRPLAARYNGTSWSAKSVQDPGSDSGFAGVGLGSSTNVWAVGHQTDGTGKQQPLAEHYDGSAWSIVAVPSLAHGGGLSSVTVLSSTNVWAAGTAFDASGNLLTLIEHYDGTAWSQVTSPSPSATDNQLSGISGNGASDVWAVGQYFNANKGTEFSLLLHYDGSSWTQVNHGHVGSADSFRSVKAVSSTDVWAAGDFVRTSDGRTSTLIYHYDGTSWTQSPTPNGQTNGGVLYGVASSGPTSSFAVGTHTDSSSLERTLALHCAC